MKKSSRVSPLIALCLSCVCGCIGTVDSVQVVRGTIQDNGVDSKRTCDLVMYNERDKSIIAIDHVLPFTDFIVGFDTPYNLRSFTIGIRCPDAATEYRSESFQAGRGEIDLDQVQLRVNNAK